MRIFFLFIFCALLLACCSTLIQDNGPSRSSLSHQGFFPGIGIVADSPDNTGLMDSSLRIINPRFRNILVK